MTDHGFTTAVGSSVLFENAQVRVWDFLLKPGEWSAFHRHMNDYVIIYVADGQLELETIDEPPIGFAAGDGYVSHTRVGSADDSRLTHRLGNVGDQPHRHLVIELLGTRSPESAPMEIESNDPRESLRRQGP